MTTHLLLYMIRNSDVGILYTATYSYRRVYTGPVRLVDGKFPNWVHRFMKNAHGILFFFIIIITITIILLQMYRYDRSTFLLFRRRVKFLRCTLRFFTFLFSSLYFHKIILSKKNCIIRPHLKDQ